MSQIANHRAARRLLDTLDAPIAVLDAQPPGGVTARATVLLVPGYTGGKEDFAPLLRPLANAGYRAVAMDLPGQYQSPGPTDPTVYTTEWLGTVVCAVAKGLDDGPVHLVGHSFGGLVARAAILANPANVCSLTLLGSGPSAIVGVRRDRMLAIEPLLEYGMEVVYEAIEQVNALDPRWTMTPAALKAFLRERFLASSLAGLQGMGNALLNEVDRVDQLAEVGVPVLVCYGDGDDAWPPAVQAEMAGRLSAQHEIIVGAAHSPALEDSTATAAVLLSFWEQISGKIKRAFMETCS